MLPLTIDFSEVRFKIIQSERIHVTDANGVVINVMSHEK